MKECCSIAYHAKGMCKSCYFKHWYDLNKQKEKERCAKFYLKNKDKRLKDGKTWRTLNKDKLKTYYDKRLKEDLSYKLRCYLRIRLRAAIKNHQKSGSAVSDLGCSIEFFKVYIESKFYPNKITNENMNWDNYGERWQFDHIKELKNFNLSNRKDFLVACHYSNIQPMWNEDHSLKTSNFNKRFGGFNDRNKDS